MTRHNATNLKVQSCKFKKVLTHFRPMLPFYTPWNGLINDRLSVKKYPEISYFSSVWFCSYKPVKFFIISKSSLPFNSLYCIFCLCTNSLPLNNLKTRKAMSPKLCGFAIYIKAICNLHDCTFKSKSHHLFTPKQK